MMREEDIRARELAIKKCGEEMQSYMQKAQEQGTADTPEFFKGMAAIGKRYDVSFPTFDLAEGPNDMLPEVNPDALIALYRENRFSFRGIGGRFNPEDSALRTRAAHLKLLESIDTVLLPEEAPDFSVLKKDGRISDTAIRVFAKFPVKKMVIGDNPGAIDFEAFIREVQRELRRAKEGEWTELL